MSIAGPAFVTGHAVRRFRERVADLPYEHALAAIIHGLKGPDIKVSPAGGGRGVMVRTMTPYRMRLYVMPPEKQLPGKSQPLVVTVLRG